MRPELGQATHAVRTGQHQFVDDQHSEALALTSSYTFDDAFDAAEKFAQRRPGNVYVRFTNPTVRAFEERIASMEGARDAVATGSGMGAYIAVSLALLEQGDHVLLAEGVFGTTTTLYRGYMRKFGVSTTVVDVRDNEAWSAAVRPTTKMILVESPTNPLMRVADIGFLSRLAREHDLFLVVDNTLCTPVFQLPHTMGADLVIHSAGKYIDGQGRCGGGVVTGDEDLIAEVRGVLRTVGPSLSPFNAWIFLKGLETLPIRMRAHDERAAEIYAWLSQRDDLDAVHFTGSPDHPQVELVARQQTGHGGLVSFEIAGGRREAWTFVDNLRLVSNTTNIGDTKSMITHPGTTTHGRLPDEAKLAAGIKPNLVRLSVGLEDPADLLADLHQALAKSQIRKLAG
ncbi:O-succinylhomoserine sulfhydrylase [Kibdelosporangium persicum]|uniref:O-succinylhomoserine sulfhydrylase n=1 Tax=Kibdelosporangium persicum TaxID=2698649 RepID=A0ABX2FIN3_9PSEU|nr:O-succinylhomoserine sulfhydrylase [Kibdelosporangium persicum]NRN70979.1 O-succinylhomoserine sulfhydrylase [Kibdelosporangium persicum]